MLRFKTGHYAVVAVVSVVGSETLRPGPARQDYLSVEVRSVKKKLKKKGFTAKVYRDETRDGAFFSLRMVCVLP
jgi:predicted hydrolase (HD superfamily)